MLLMQGAQGLIPAQGTRSHKLKLKILHATNKTQHKIISKELVTLRVEEKKSVILLIVT